jgi:hypothetical protein
MLFDISGRACNDLPMATNGKNVSELVRAAEEVESELARLEALSQVAQRTRLDSDKNISRATKELSEALEMPARLADCLGALALAMQNMQARQKAALDPLAARADLILERKQRLAVHMQAFETLGKATEAATEVLKGEGERSELVEELKTKLVKLADDARALFETARADDFQDVASASDALAKSATALRRRLESEQQ